MWRRAVVAGFAVALLQACGVFTQQRSVTSPSSTAFLDRQSPYLKAHLKNGDAVVLERWAVDDTARVVTGRGRRLDWNRQVRDTGDFRISLDSVALFETNVLQRSGGVAAMTVLTGISLGVTVFCLTNTKACFGSCPTFYASDGDHDLLQAEGFSASVAPSLEATDVDALFRARVNGRDLTLRMKNEALETHVVKYVRLLVAERPAGGRVFATPAGEFRGATALTRPTACRGPDGDCLSAVEAFDGLQRISRTDSTDLAARETIDLIFETPPAGDLGLVLAARQSLVSTYVFYQELAYLGRRAGDWLAMLERAGRPAREGASGPGRLLGKIEVLVASGPDEWTAVGETGETGPLATDVKIVPLPRPASAGAPLRIRLRMAQGAWRIDWAALARLGSRVEPRRLAPTKVRASGRTRPELAAWLADSTRPLVTAPGDEVRFAFRLPGSPHGDELFLETRGYYLEWMRHEWLGEENAVLAAELFLDPAAGLQRLAPEYKRHEAGLEQAFWNSRYVRP